MRFIKSLRPFIGSLNFRTSSAFYRDLGFKEKIITDNFSYFDFQGFGFYLQDYYVKEWINNSALFMEVDDVNGWWDYLASLHLDKKYQGIKIIPPRKYNWGQECFLTDPAGVLWHFGGFY